MFFDKLIHLPTKIFFPFHNKDKETYQNFQNSGYLHIVSDKNNVQFASDLYNNLLNINFKKIIEEKTLNNENVYTVNIYEYLDHDTKDKINNFFNNKEKIFTVSSMLGFKAKLRKVHVLINFFNKKTNQDEGPKMYHRDSDSLNDQVKIFFLLNDLKNDNGMFYFVPKNYIDENTKLPFENDRKDMQLWNKWRNYDKTVLKYAKYNEDDFPIKKLKGKKGEMLYIDTGKVYHKGGYINEENTTRFLLQAVYTPVLSLSNWNNNSNKLMKFVQNKLTTLRIKLRRTLT
jgi:hypothetical protein